MYRFGKEDLPEIYNERIETIKSSFLNAYETNLNKLTEMIIDLHAESSLIDELKLNKNNDLSEDNYNKKIEKINKLKNEEFESFKNDIDYIVFPCCLDILKIEIIKSFNGHIYKSLQPKIEELMAKVD